jgi:hypothetical protein
MENEKSIRSTKESEVSGTHNIAETYADDMAKVIGSGEVGMVKKIIHGEEEHEKEKKDLSPESKKNKLFIAASLVFWFLALFIFLFFLFFNKKINTVPVAKPFVPIIFNDKSTFWEVKDLKRDEIIETVFNEANTTKVKDGGVEGIYLSSDKKVINFRRFLTLTKSNLSLDGISSDLVSDNFLLGVVNGQTKDFFILIKVRSIPDIFDSLRRWENKMFFDLHGFFGIEISPETKYLLTENFKDGIVENKNTRILYDKDNNIVMMYILADDNSVIITNTINAAHEIMLRLASSRVEK